MKQTNRTKVTSGLLGTDTEDSGKSTRARHFLARVEAIFCNCYHDKGEEEEDTIIILLEKKEKEKRKWLKSMAATKAVPAAANKHLAQAWSDPWRWRRTEGQGEGIQ